MTKPPVHATRPVIRPRSIAALLLIALGPAAIVALLSFYHPGGDAPPGAGYIVPPDSSAFLTWRDNLTGEERAIPLPVTPGQSIRLFAAEAGPADRPLDDVWDAGLHSADEPADRPTMADVFADRFHIAVREEALLPTGGSRFAFHYLRSTHPLMRLLRQRERLDDVVAGAASEFDGFCKLLLWTRAQLVEGVPNPYPPVDALEILDMVRSGQTRAFCGQYAQVLVQSLISLGYQARYVGLASHEVLEVWSNEHVKWIVLDPYNGWYFRQAGVPLTALEVHEHVCADRAGEIEVVRLDPGVPRAPAEQLTQYRTFNVSMFNNHPDLGNSGTADVETQWQRRVYWLDRCVERPPSDGKPRMLTAFAADIYFNINTVAVKLWPEEPGVVDLTLDSFTPEIERLERQIDDGPWEPTPEQFTWRLHAGVNTLAVRAINAVGIVGPVSRLVLEYTP